jgi:hypothetical protein
MSITGIVMHTLLWRQHLQNLRLVNDALIKNG